jgi:hypothetical protein
MAATDKFNKVLSGTTRPVATTLAAQKLSGANSATVVATTGWETTTAVHGIMYRTDAGTGEKVAGSQIDFKADVSGTTLSNFTVTAGTDDTYEIGTTVELAPTAAWGDDMATGILVEHNQDGTHSDITATSITATTGTFDSVVINGSANNEGWSALGDVPDTVTYNGNRSYDLVFNGNDLTDTVSEGMRLKLARTVTPPTQCTDLESGSSQYWSKTSPAGTTFTDDFCTGAWVKLESYTNGAIIARYNGTSGWVMDLVDGRVRLVGFNGGAGNYSLVETYQSLPLNKWVHVAAQLDMSAFTATTTTSYVMIDGVDVPCTVNRAGTNPTSLTQAGDLQIGASNGTSFFDGKIAQAWYSNAKIAQSTIQTFISQGMTGSETSIVSHYDFSGDANDNNANANNLSANGGVAATTTDSPYNATEFGIVTKKAFSTNTTLTVQVPEGYAIPASGGVSSVYYSTHKTPYGFPSDKGKWEVVAYFISLYSVTFAGTAQWTAGGAKFNVPIGAWNVGYSGPVQFHSTVAGARFGHFTLASTAPTNGAYNHPRIAFVYEGASTVDAVASPSVFYPESLSAATNFTIYASIASSTGTETFYFGTGNGVSKLVAEFNYI